MKIKENQGKKRRWNQVEWQKEEKSKWKIREKINEKEKKKGRRSID